MCGPPSPASPHSPEPSPLGESPGHGQAQEPRLRRRSSSGSSEDFPAGQSRAGPAFSRPSSSSSCSPSSILVERVGSREEDQARGRRRRSWPPTSPAPSPQAVGSEVLQCKVPPAARATVAGYRAGAAADPGPAGRGRALPGAPQAQLGRARRKGASLAGCKC